MMHFQHSEPPNYKGCSSYHLRKVEQLSVLRKQLYTKYTHMDKNGSENNCRKESKPHSVIMPDILSPESQSFGWDIAGIFKGFSDVPLGEPGVASSTQPPLPLPNERQLRLRAVAAAATGDRGDRFCSPLGLLLLLRDSP
ncbi:Serine/Threonine-Protein Kinase Lmtk1 [Manis pentadactyla]|nr:Serine/Threonine-Protein Kinase Lmtk1 [Manis pentadactyla]